MPTITTNEHTVKIHSVALLTDLGTKDCSAASLEAMILRKNFGIRVIHMSHAVPSGSVSTAAMFLEVNYRNYPGGTAFVAIVDSEANKNSRIIFARCSEYYFIGPDNGIFTRVFERTRPHQIIELNQKRLHSEDISNMIISAAVLSNRFLLSDLGEDILEDPIVKLDPFTTIQDGKLVTEVLCINNRGDLIIGLTEKELKGFTNGNSVGIIGNSVRFGNFANNSSKLSQYVPRLLFNGSFGKYGVMAMKKGSAKDFSGASIGTKVTISNIKQDQQ